MRFPILLVVFFVASLSSSSNAGDRPNILWISCEDISPHLRCYGDRKAVTPNLDSLAAEGTRFTHAFSCHGVCAPSRTGIITGMYPISLGANHMRSKVKLPEHVKLFPQYLRQSGYYCTNNSKTDYNLVWDQKAVWDESSGKAHWKNRPATETPFFAVFNLTMTHESQVWPKNWTEVVRVLPEEKRHRPEDVTVPPLYPETPAVRADLARLADLITVMDLRVGELLQELTDAGLAEDTIVVFWSDHGDGLPRAKRWTYDSGTRVPLIVRTPEKYRTLTGLSAPGTIDERLVNLIDLAPSMLRIAGVRQPDHMQGIPFLGPASGQKREFIHGARDRIDERFDMVRTVRSREFRYVRNLMPWRPALQNVVYGEQNETLREMRRLLAERQLAQESAQWFRVPRHSEELYDLDADPWELVNLVDRPEYEETLQTLSIECDRWQIEVRDAHLLPEIMLDEGEMQAGTRWQILHGQDGALRVARLLDAAKQAAQLNPLTATAIAGFLDSDPAVRWWQLTLLSRAPQVGARTERLLLEANSPGAALRIAASAGLARAGRLDESVNILRDALKSGNEFVRHAAILEIDEAGRDTIRPLRELLSADQNEDYFRRLAEHALSQL